MFLSFIKNLNKILFYQAPNIWEPFLYEEIFKILIMNKMKINSFEVIKNF